MRRYEPQQPCPSCGEPMDGVGWITTCHHEDGLRCPDASHWVGPWGHCAKCTTEQVALAVEERIARELERIADSYIPVSQFVDPNESVMESLDKVLGEKPGGMTDIWTWTGQLAERVRAGEFTKPCDTEPPF